MLIIISSAFINVKNNEFTYLLTLIYSACKEIKKQKKKKLCGGSCFSTSLYAFLCMYIIYVYVWCFILFTWRIHVNVNNKMYIVLDNAVLSPTCFLLVKVLRVWKKKVFKFFYQKIDLKGCYFWKESKTCWMNIDWKMIPGANGKKWSCVVSRLCFFEL